MIMRRTPIISPEPQQPLKSYRQRRAQSRSNHNHLQSTTDTKGLQQIQDTLYKRRMSIQQNQVNLFGSFVEEEVEKQELMTVRIKTQPMGDMEVREYTKEVERKKQDQKLQETQASRIISKYADALEFIREVEQQQFIQKINPEIESKMTKPIVPPIKNFPIGQSKKVSSVRSSFNLSKITAKPITTDLNNFITPRKIGGTVKPAVKSFGVGVTGSVKSQRKVPEGKNERKMESGKGKMEQQRFVKKLEGLEEELGRLGFEKESEAKWHLRNILELLKDG